MYRQILVKFWIVVLKFESGVTFCVKPVSVFCKIYNISLRTTPSNYFLHHIQHGHFSQCDVPENVWWLAPLSMIDEAHLLRHIINHFKCSTLRSTRTGRKTFKRSWPISKRMPIRMQSPVVLSTDLRELALWKKEVRTWRYQCIAVRIPQIPRWDQAWPLGWPSPQIPQISSSLYIGLTAPTYIMDWFLRVDNTQSLMHPWFIWQAIPGVFDVDHDHLWKLQYHRLVFFSAGHTVASQTRCSTPSQSNRRR